MKTNFLLKPDVTRFSIADHVEFHKLSYRTVRNNETVIQAPELINAYQAAVEQESDIYKWIRKSEYTEKKEKADHDRGQVYKGLVATVQAALNHFDPTTQEKAAHVHVLLQGYGDVNHMDYDGQTAAVDSIITNLRSPKYQNASLTLGLFPWINELEAKNNLFKTLVDDATEEKLEKPKVKPTVARHETDVALRAVTDRVSALATLNGPDNYQTFADEFNVRVEHYNSLVREHYGRLHAKIDLSNGEVDPIDVQSYTGKPVYVIPEVKLRKTEKDGTETVTELVFTDDFTVGYKNNVDPGTATLTITGAGKYAGEIVTTFNIVESES
jgi:hypothetical protein